MHCSANIGPDGATALSSASQAQAKPPSQPTPGRTLIGDDEHGWSDNGVFNFEGGCYAKVIKLSKKAEPDIWRRLSLLRGCARKRRNGSPHPPT